MRVLGSQCGFTGSNVPNRQTEHYTGNQGKSFEEQAHDLGIRTEPIIQINSQSERNQDLKNAYSIKSGKNTVMINESEDFANNTKKSNERYYDKKH